MLARTANGDQAAFRQLHRTTAKRLGASVRKIQPNAPHAEEIVQEVFLKIWTAAGDFDPVKGMPSTWLGSIARNAALDSLRRERARPRISALPQDPEDNADVMDRFASDGPGTFEIASRRSDAKSLCSCMQRLPDAHRQSLALAYFHELSHVEVALHMRQPLGTVKSWLRRSLTTLRTCLSEPRDCTPQWAPAPIKAEPSARGKGSGRSAGRSATRSAARA